MREPVCYYVATIFTDKHFMARVGVLLDVYRVMAEGSRSLQRLQSLPWESMKDFGTTILTLRKMTNTLETRKDPTVVELFDLADMDTIWPNLSKSQPLDKDVVSETRFANFYMIQTKNA